MQTESELHAAGRLSLSFEEPLSLRSTAPTAVVDAMAAALSMELPSAGGRDAAGTLVAPWRPRGILVRCRVILEEYSQHHHMNKAFVAHRG